MGVFSIIYRKLRKTSFIFMCIIPMLLFFLLMVGNVENVTKSIVELNNQLTQNYIDIVFSDGLDNKNIVDLITDIEKNDDIIIKYCLQTGFGYDVESYGIFFNGEYNNGYNLLDGRFFAVDDFNANKKVAVIGKGVLKSTIIEENKKYILRGLDKYEVIGVIGKKDISSRYDNSILFNLDSILSGDEILSKDAWWLDSTVRNETQLIQLMSSYGDKVNVLNRTDDVPNPLDQALKRSDKLIISFMLIILCVLLTLIRVILYWIDSISLEIGIRKSYGALDKSIFVDLMSRFVIISGISIVITLILYEILFMGNFMGLVDFKLSFINIILCIVFIFLIGVVFISISIYKMKKIEITQLLKGL